MKRKRLLMDIVLILLVVVSGIMLFKGKKDPKLDDYNYFWETVEDGYPFYTFLNEDNRLEKVKEKYKKEVKELDYKNSEEIDKFYGKMINEITENKNYGHFSTIKFMYEGELKHAYITEGLKNTSKENKIKFFSIFDIKEEDIEEAVKEFTSGRKINNEIILSEKSKNYYEITKDEDKKIQESAKKFLESKESVEEISRQSIDKNTYIDNSIYINIPSFGMDSNDEQKNIDEIIEYIKENKERENLIIDIRENPGGDSSYWISIVKELLKKDEVSKFYSLSKNSEITTKYKKMTNDNKIKIEEIEKFKDEIPEYKTIKDKYGKDFDNIEIRKRNITSNKEGPIYSGKIWVLTSEKNYSASTEFINLCNSTDYITTVGTKNFGGDNGWGYTPYLQLPNCGMIFRFEQGVALNDDLLPTDIYGVAPDIYTEEDALEYVKNLIKK